MQGKLDEADDDSESSSMETDTPDYPKMHDNSAAENTEDGK